MIFQSFSAMTEMVEFLPRQEVVKLQQLNWWFYHRRLQQIQMSLSFAREEFFFTGMFKGQKHDLFFYDQRKGQAGIVSDPKFDFENSVSISVASRLYSWQLNQFFVYSREPGSRRIRET